MKKGGFTWFTVRAEMAGTLTSGRNRTQKEGRRVELSSISLLLFIQAGAQPRDGATHIQGGSLLLHKSSLETPTHPEVCLLGESKSSQVANEVNDNHHVDSRGPPTHNQI